MLLLFFGLSQFPSGLFNVVRITLLFTLQLRGKTCGVWVETQSRIGMANKRFVLEQHASIRVSRALSKYSDMSVVCRIKSVIKKNGCGK